MLNNPNTPAMTRRRQAREAGPAWDYANGEKAQLCAKGHSAGDLVTSIVDRDERKHVPVIDLDVPAILYPSTNNWHLMVDVQMSWWKYALLLKVLSFVGIIERGYAKASIKRGYSAIRKPLALQRRQALDRIQDMWECDINSHPLP